MLKKALNSGFVLAAVATVIRYQSNGNANKLVDKPEQVRIKEISMFLGCSIVCGKLLKFALNYRLIA